MTLPQLLAEIKARAENRNEPESVEYYKVKELLAALEIALDYVDRLDGEEYQECKAEIAKLLEGV